VKRQAKGTFVLRSILLVFLFVQTSCAAAQETPPPASTAAEPVSTATSAPPTIPPATDTPTHTATITPTSTPEILIRSLNSFQEIPAGYLAPGEIILNEASYLENVEHEGHLLFSVSGENLEIQPFLQNLQDDWIGHYSVSHDNQWLAIRRSMMRGDIVFYDLILTTSDTSSFLVLPWDEPMGTDGHTDILSWTGDNQNLLLGRPGSEFAEVVLFNPFEDIKEVIFPDPDLGYVSASYSRFKWYGGVSVVYSPDMTRVISIDGFNKGEFILFDLENNLEIRRFTDASFISLWSTPAWSPDSNYFAIVEFGDDEEFQDGIGPYHVVLYNREGEEFWRSDTLLWNRRILTALFDLDWSPDSKYFKYHVIYPDSEDIYTRILDIETGDLRQYPFWGFSYAWSPDSSQYIILEDTSLINDSTSKYRGLNIVNMERLEVLHLDSLLYIPVAWLTMNE